MNAALPLLFALASGANAARPQPGQAAPDFALAASNGQNIRLADYRGKNTVVLAFFPKAFTGG